MTDVCLQLHKSYKHTSSTGSVSSSQKTLAYMLQNILSFIDKLHDWGAADSQSRREGTARTRDRVGDTGLGRRERRTAYWWRWAGYVGQRKGRSGRHPKRTGPSIAQLAAQELHRSKRHHKRTCPAKSRRKFQPKGASFGARITLDAFVEPSCALFARGASL